MIHQDYFHSHKAGAMLHCTNIQRKIRGFLYRENSGSRDYLSSHLSRPGLKHQISAFLEDSIRQILQTQLKGPCHTILRCAKSGNK
jgi:hypothetical protein